MFHNVILNMVMHFGSVTKHVIGHAIGYYKIHKKYVLNNVLIHINIKIFMLILNKNINAFKTVMKYNKDHIVKI